MSFSGERWGDVRKLEVMRERACYHTYLYLRKACSNFRMIRLRIIYYLLVVAQREAKLCQTFAGNR